MATNRTTVNEEVDVTLDGNCHTLVLTVRADVLLTVEQHEYVLSKTLGMWMSAYQNVTKLDDEHAQTFQRPSAIDMLRDEHNVTLPNDDENPLCTVWNKGKGRTLVVHSHTTGQQAIATWYAMDSVVNSVLDKFGASNTSAPTQQPASAQQQAQQSAPTQMTGTLPPLRAFVRSTQQGDVDSMLAIESGKVDSPNFSKQAVLAKGAYPEPNTSYRKGALVLYPLEGGKNVHIKQPTDKRVLEIVTQGGGQYDSLSIWEREGCEYDGKHIPSDWESALGKLGLSDDAPLGAYELNADYVAVKVGKQKDNGGQWMNFYGFYNAPGKQVFKQPHPRDEASVEDTY